MSGVFLCRFDTDLSDLSKKDKRNPDKVVEILKLTGKFSCFDIDDTLAPVITQLLSSGRVENVGGEYPWTNVKIKEYPLKEQK